MYLLVNMPNSVDTNIAGIIIIPYVVSLELWFDA